MAQFINLKGEVIEIDEQIYVDNIDRNIERPYIGKNMSIKELVKDTLKTEYIGRHTDEIMPCLLIGCFVDADANLVTSTINIFTALNVIYDYKVIRGEEMIESNLEFVERCYLELVDLVKKGIVTRDVDNSLLDGIITVTKYDTKYQLHALSVINTFIRAFTSVTGDDYDDVGLFDDEALHKTHRLHVASLKNANTFTESFYVYDVSDNNAIPGGLFLNKKTLKHVDETPSKFVQ